MSKRLETLQKVIDAGNRDPFARYALGMEFRSLDRLEESLATFEALRAESPDYVAQYLMAGGVAMSLGRRDAARTWFEQGIEVAKARRDDHTLRELQAALGQLEGEV